METLTKTEAMSLYKESSQAGKDLLIKKYGKDLFLTDIEKIDTLEDIIKYGKPDQDMLTVLNYAGDNKHMIGLKWTAFLFLLTELYNEGWEADYANKNQKKWFPVFNGLQGFAFSGSYFDHWGTSAYVGSRHCFASQELSDKAAKKFPQIFKGTIDINSK